MKRAAAVAVVGALATLLSVSVEAPNAVAESGESQVLRDVAAQPATAAGLGDIRGAVLTRSAIRGTSRGATGRVRRNPAMPAAGESDGGRPAPPPVNCRVKKCVALTFDDGPAAHTQRLLRSLRKGRTKATFFMVGRRIKGQEATVLRALREGHQLGTHTWDHPDLRRLSFAGVDAQIGAAQRELHRVTGVRPSVFRPPYGATSGSVVRSTTNRRLPQIMWDVDPRDWEFRDSRRVAEHVAQHTRRNSIVLLHDIHPSTVDAVPEIIRRLRARGFVMVTVAEIFPRMKAGEFYPPSARHWWRAVVPHGPRGA